MTDTASHSEALEPDLTRCPVMHAPAGGRDVGGCPVMQRDFSRAEPAGSYWQEANKLREAGPLFFNTFAQGYWVFTRYDAVRDIYKTPEIFSSESITPWQPDPIYRFVPTQIDAPDHLKYRRIVNPWFSPREVDKAEPAMRSLCRGLVEELAPAGSCDFVNGFALRYPTEAYLGVIGIEPSEADLFVPWVEDFFRGFGADPDGLEPMAKALDGIREYWVVALDEKRGEPTPHPGDLASHLLHSTRCSSCLEGAARPCHVQRYAGSRARCRPSKRPIRRNWAESAGPAPRLLAGLASI